MEYLNLKGGAHIETVVAVMGLKYYKFKKDEYEQNLLILHKGLHE